MSHTYYSQRAGTNPNLNGLPLDAVVGLFFRVYVQMRNEGYFDEQLGSHCVDLGEMAGVVKDVSLDIFLAIRKSDIWPIEEFAHQYSEDDLFDIIEYLFHHVSKPIDGTLHNYADCGMHWETFNRAAGQAYYVLRINDVLQHYVRKFEISDTGFVLLKAEQGMDKLFAADVPSESSIVTSRVESAIVSYRRHGASLDDRRKAVRELADVLELLRPKIKAIITRAEYGTKTICRKPTLMELG